VTVGPPLPYRLGESKPVRLGLKHWKVIHLQELDGVSYVPKLFGADVAAAVVWPSAEGR
jgi:hypothetical protein